MAFEREYREMGFVPRWSVLRNLKQQSVAEHSYFVAIYARQIAHLIGWDGDPAALLTCALIHDLPEVITGDPPGPAKHATEDQAKAQDFEAAQMNRLFPDMMPARVYAPDVKAIIKAADLVEAVMYLCDEANLGNKSVGTMDFTFTGQDPCFPSKPSALRSNYWAMKDAWLRLPAPRDVLDPAYRNHLLPAIWNAYRGLSRILEA